ncbi:Rha family transcriptional regulator [Paenibacillus humicus]|uniref:Rha family transcriptional regulator n=1 Tax=Paenibacillus humicus TaxID=412861 RepID=UPI003D2AACA9
MNQLQVVQRDGKFLVDSRDVAEMIGKQHKDLLRDIRNYNSILLSANLRSVDFFIESTYQDDSGRTLPCFLLTRKGCDMVANKMTGEKGVLFTAAYVTKFEEMEQQQAINLTGLSPQLQILIQQEQQIKQIKSQVDTLTHGLTATPDHTKVVQRVNEYARWTRMGHNEVYNRIYDVMKARFGIDVKTRAENERDRIDQEYFERTGKHYSLSTLKKKVNGIDVMVRMGVLDKFNEILVGMLAAVKKTG